MNDKFLKNGLYNAAAGAIRIGLGVLTIPVLIRLIGVEEYGLWTLASAVVTMVTLAEAGLSTTTTVFISQDLSREDTESLSQTLTITVGAMLILATLAAMALCFGAENLVNFFPKLENKQHLAAVQALQIAGLVVWARLLQQVIIGVEQAYQQYGAMNLLITLQSIVSSLGLLIVAFLGGKTVALMQFQAFVNMGSLVAHLWLSWLPIVGIKPHLLWNTSKVLDIFRYSITTWVASIGAVLFGQVDRLVVGAVLGIEILGVYAAITNITMQINTFSALLTQPLIPSVSSLFAQGTVDAFSRIKKYIKQALLINIVTSFTLGGILITIAPFILKLMLQSSFKTEYIFGFQFLSIIYSLYSVNAVGYYVLFCLNLASLNMIIVISSGSLSLLLIFLLSMNFGLFGAILGNLGYLLTISLTIYVVKKVELSYMNLLNLILVPCSWLFVCMITALLAPYGIIIRLLIFSVECILFLLWFKFQLNETIYN